MHLAVLSRVPTQMPLEVQTDHRTHGTQLGSDLVLCLLNAVEECKTRVRVGQDLSLGGPAANQGHHLFCPIPAAEHVPGPLACVAMCGGHLNTENLSLEFLPIFCTILIMQAQGTRQLMLPNLGRVLSRKGGRHSFPR